MSESLHTRTIVRTCRQTSFVASMLEASRVLCALCGCTEGLEKVQSGCGAATSKRLRWESCRSLRRASMIPSSSLDVSAQRGFLTHSALLRAFWSQSRAVVVGSQTNKPGGPYCTTHASRHGEALNVQKCEIFPISR